MRLAQGVGFWRACLRRILIANRGEIAIRIARTCHAMGIAPIAIFAGDDRHSPHVGATDESIAIGPSYRDSARIIQAAKQSRADAIHPGYGFLAEDADFAEACEQAGLVFIGPTPHVIRQMGSKAAARSLAEACGIPVVPAFDPGGHIDFPVLIKPSAGGGGRGIRLVKTQSDLDESLPSARSEAERSFGDPTLLIERYIEGARHVEIQIFGDHHGRCIHLFERDCTIQRRYQKIIEESPCPGLDDAVRQQLCDAALKLARAIGYTNAGTVEFLLAPSGQFYFLEVNTRIQVEHPVTEMVTGLDLVRLQIEVAQGLPLTVQPQTRGHAIEARLYAEGPGLVRVWLQPTGVRVDSGIVAGQEIGIGYDPLLAKIIAHGPDRETARHRLIRALESTIVMGVPTNRTELLDVEHASACSPLPEIWFEAAATLYREKNHPRPLPGVPPNYRNNPIHKPAATAEVIACEPGFITLSIDGIRRRIAVDLNADEIWLQYGRHERVIRIPPRFPPPASFASRAANSPMPGQVLRILVQAGQQVSSGDSLLVLEAMKMEQTIRTTINGVVQSILVEPGQVVAPGQMLVEIRALEPTV